MKKNVESIKQILKSHGPVTTLFYEVDSEKITNYKKGVYIPDNNCGYSGDHEGVPYFLDTVENKYVPFNHAVAIVGYGFEQNDSGEKIDYWIVKNSYGSDWGEDGYIKFAAGKNYCGIETYIKFFENNLKFTDDSLAIK